MCGIAGWLGTLPDSAKAASRMVQAMHYQGPGACT
jgi:asparagine synthetase B (glutamine-hydrolysing)